MQLVVVVYLQLISSCIFFVLKKVSKVLFVCVYEQLTRQGRTRLIFSDNFRMYLGKLVV